MQIQPLKAFTDNYIWVITTATGHWVVDPGDAAVVNTFIDASTLPLAGILITHHHPDHTGGVDKLAGPNIAVYGPANLPIKCDYTVVDEHSTPVIDGAAVTILKTPGHTLDHIAYLIDGHLFCGDTLFSAGCGRLFEGTAEMMYHSLQRLVNSDSQLIYPTHEYTLANLQFANYIEPNNQEINYEIERVTALRSNNEPSLPTTWAKETTINPFIRDDQRLATAVAKLTNKEASNNIELFAQIRTLKDNY